MKGKFAARIRLLRGSIVLLLLLIWFIPLPYYIFEPGSAEELQPMMSVEGGEKDEKGALMLTTVLTVPVKNLYYLGYGAVMPNREIVERESVDGGMPDEEYQKALRHMMSSSQENAVVAAMRYLGMPVEVRYLGAVVSSVASYSKAKDILKPGDVIERVDDFPVGKRDDLIRYLSGKQAGDRVTLQFVRDGEKRVEPAELVRLLDPKGRPLQRVGLGIELVTKQQVENPLKVDFQTEKIGGPSAGLMFALEIVSQLTPGDLTKGHKIAGTGMIDADGKVGQIGGIQHKVVAAHEKGAEIFFTPADVEPEKDTNTRIALEKAAEIGTGMKIVPVRSLADAVDYLKRLP